MGITQHRQTNAAPITIRGAAIATASGDVILKQNPFLVATA